MKFIVCSDRRYCKDYRLLSNACPFKPKQLGPPQKYCNTYVSWKASIIFSTFQTMADKHKVEILQILNSILKQNIDNLVFIEGSVNLFLNYTIHHFKLNTIMLDSIPIKLP